MKVGVISDIHSNFDALKVVLDYFNQINVDKIICLGDIIGIGNKPDETVKLLMKYQHKLYAVRGNHEGYLIDGLPKYIHGGRAMTIEEVNNHKWNHNMVSKEAKEFLKSLKVEEYINLDNTKIYISHFPLSKNGKYLAIDFKEHKELEYYNDIDADICLFGHTHKRYYDKKSKYIINPGSLGCPKESGAAEAGILTIIDKDITYEQLEIKYNVDKVIEEIISSDMPMKEKMIKIFYR